MKNFMGNSSVCITKTLVSSQYRQYLSCATKRNMHYNDTFDIDDLTKNITMELSSHHLSLQSMENRRCESGQERLTVLTRSPTRRRVTAEYSNRQLLQESLLERLSPSPFSISHRKKIEIPGLKIGYDDDTFWNSDLSAGGLSVSKKEKPQPCVSTNHVDGTSVEKTVKKKQTSPRLSHNKNTSIVTIATNPAVEKKSVHFGKVTIREYPRILGDNPGCDEGPSLSIGWEYEERSPMPLSDYESLRFRWGFFREMKLSREKRKDLLNRIGYTDADISESIRSSNRIRHQRKVSTLTSMVNEKVFRAVGNASRRVRRVVLRPTGHETLF